MSTQIKTNTLHLSKDHHGYWLWDNTRNANLSMRAKSEQAAFIETIEYYQKRLSEVETSYKTLQKAVDAFINTVNPEEME